MALAHNDFDTPSAPRSGSAMFALGDWIADLGELVMRTVGALGAIALFTLQIFDASLLSNRRA